MASPLMPKSATMANGHAKVCAAAVVAALRGEAPNGAPTLVNTCYSMVSEKMAVHVASVLERADDFDVIHSHVYHFALPFGRLVRTGTITPAEFHRLRGRLLSDIASGLWRVLQVTPADFQQAQQLLVRHATTRSLRTLDALQLAVALGLHGRGLVTQFVCADQALCAIATAEGLAVVNPEVP